MKALEITTETQMRSYRVTLRSTVTVEVEVDAKTVEEARAKAFGWSPREGQQEPIGGYWLHNGDTDEDDYIVDDGEMYWEIVNSEPIDIDEVIVLKDDEDDEEAVQQVSLHDEMTLADGKPDACLA